MGKVDLPEWILCQKCLSRAYLRAWAYKGEVFVEGYECEKCGKVWEVE